jgi:hypothetical protein
MKKEVEYPWHLRHGIKATVRGYPLPRNLRVFGGDTETCQGHAMTVQCSAAEDDLLFSYCDDSSCFMTLWDWIRPRLRVGGVNLCYFHKLNFDSRVLFAPWHREIYAQRNDCRFTIPGGLEISMLFGKVNKVTIEYGKTLRLQLLDSLAFTQASLEKSLKMFKLPLNKMERPPRIGQIRYDSLPKDHPERVYFELYSKTDGHATRLLGEQIMRFHEAYQVKPAITLPAYAAKVFRHHFLKPGDSIPFPPFEVIKAAELSYHGGKNGKYPDDRIPRVYEDLCEVDINSAYPYAMKLLPPCTKGIYYKVTEFKPREAGIYCISGHVFATNKYPLVFDHTFRKVRGDFKDLWHTCFEVQRMLEDPTIRIDSIWGFTWMPDPTAYNPFARFVEHFYGKKEATTKEDPYYHFYKIVLNALYGKLVSTIEIFSEESEAELEHLRERGIELPEHVRLDERWDKVLGQFVKCSKTWRAGAMYNPFLGSLITGHTRAYLYDLEHQLNAVHSATDSVKTSVAVEAVKGLGGVKVECFGRCYIFRNKLYLHFSKSFEYCGHKPDDLPYKYPKKLVNGFPHPKAGVPLIDHDGQHLCKIAMHGYKGPLWVLFEKRYELIATSKMEYDYVHVVGLREGLRRGLTPCDFIPVTEVLSLQDFTDYPHLLSFIIKRGGFDYYGETALRGELRRWTYKESRVKGVVKMDGTGLVCDTMREICAEAGFIREGSSLDDFMTLVDSSVRGEKIYGVNYRPEEDGAPLELEEVA